MSWTVRAAGDFPPLIAVVRFNAPSSAGDIISISDLTVGTANMVYGGSAGCEVLDPDDDTHYLDFELLTTTGSLKPEMWNIPLQRVAVNPPAIASSGFTAYNQEGNAADFTTLTAPGGGPCSNSAGYQEYQDAYTAWQAGLPDGCTIYSAAGRKVYVSGPNAGDSSGYAVSGTPGGPTFATVPDSGFGPPPDSPGIGWSWWLQYFEYPPSIHNVGPVCSAVEYSSGVYTEGSVTSQGWWVESQTDPDGNGIATIYDYYRVDSTIPPDHVPTSVALSSGNGTMYAVPEAYLVDVAAAEAQGFQPILRLNVSCGALRLDTIKPDLVVPISTVTNLSADTDLHVGLYRAAALKIEDNGTLTVTGSPIKEATFSQNIMTSFSKFADIQRDPNDSSGWSITITDADFC